MTQRWTVSLETEGRGYLVRISAASEQDAREAAEILWERSSRPVSHYTQDDRGWHLLVDPMGIERGAPQPSGWFVPEGAPEAPVSSEMVLRCLRGVEDHLRAAEAQALAATVTSLDAEALAQFPPA